MTDRDRVLALLRARGRTGATSREIRHSGLTGNVSERVRELKALGHNITAKPYYVGRRKFVTYRLISEVGPVSKASLARANPGDEPELGFSVDHPRAEPLPHDAVGSGQLFDPNRFHKPLSPYSPEAA